MRPRKNVYSAKSATFATREPTTNRRNLILSLTVLQDLGAVATQDTDASGLGVADGTASVSINGGSGNVTYGNITALALLIFI